MTMPGITQHGNKTNNIILPNVITQEVYDWAGSLEDLPLYFMIQRGQEVVIHSDPLQGHEVLDLIEGVSAASIILN